MNHARVACIGAGYWGKNLVRNFHALGALHVVYDPDPGRRAFLSDSYPDVNQADSLEAVLTDAGVDAVVIATPAETHGDLVARALEVGKDVFVEKPLCLDSAVGERLVELARERESVLMVGHLLWYHPAILALKALIDSGELGRIEYIYSNRLNLGKIRREENILWSFAPHDISLILGILGEMPESVQASGGNYLQSRIADVTVSLLSFPSGVKAHVFVSWLHPYKEQKLVVVGSQSMAAFDDQADEDKLRLFPHSIDWKNQIPVARKAESRAIPFEAVEPLRAECEHFLHCVRTRETPRTDGAEGLRVLRVLQRCQDAVESDVSVSPTEADGRPVTNGGAATAASEKYFAHPSAFIDDDVEIGRGTMIWHVSHLLPGSRVGKRCRIGQNVVIGPRVVIGDGVKIQNNVCVYEGVTLEDDVFCGPSMVFTNVLNPRSEIVRVHELAPTLVRRGATLGANCTVLCGVTIGCYVFVGAGAVVLKDLPDYALAVGNPARIIGWMCRCGNRIQFEDSGGKGNCVECKRGYSRSGENVTELGVRT